MCVCVPLPNEITPIAWKIPSPSTNNFQSLNSPLSSAGTMTPCTSTVTTITAMLTGASVLALANYPEK